MKEVEGDGVVDRLLTIEGDCTELASDVSEPAVRQVWNRLGDELSFIFYFL